jgi:hypothetical protein
MRKPDRALLSIACYASIIEDMDENLDASDIAREFPDWEAWQGFNRLWHARIRGAVPPVLVHGEDLVDVRDQIIAYQWRIQADREAQR